METGAETSAWDVKNDPDFGEMARFRAPLEWAAASLPTFVVAKRGE